MSAAGAQLLRGGAFKPRTSPYTFGGLGAEGLELLCRAGRETGLPVVSEITDPRQLPLFREVDVLQVGARNMQNFEMLKELGHCGKPILRVNLDEVELTPGMELSLGGMQYVDATEPGGDYLERIVRTLLAERKEKA